MPVHKELDLICQTHCVGFQPGMQLSMEVDPLGGGSLLKGFLSFQQSLWCGVIVVFEMLWFAINVGFCCGFIEFIY